VEDAFCVLLVVYERRELMAVVYRYTDLSDNIIKYVGIVWSGNRTLKQRVKEHRERDEWCKNGKWKIEYLSTDVQSRTDAELLEAHYISKFATYDWYNINKKDWGESTLLDNHEEEEWILYSSDEETKSDMNRSAIVKDVELFGNDELTRSFYRVYLSDGAEFVINDNLDIKWDAFSDEYPFVLNTHTDSFGSFFTFEGNPIEYVVSEVDGMISSVGVSGNFELKSALLQSFEDARIMDTIVFPSAEDAQKRLHEDKIFSWLIPNNTNAENMAVFIDDYFEQYVAQQNN